MRQIPRPGVPCLVLCALLLVDRSPASGQARNGESTPQTFAQLPLQFEANEGQLDRRVKFVARGAGYDAFFTADETVLALAGTAPGKAGAVVRMRLVDANPRAPVTGRSKLAGVVNYFVGGDAARWRTNVATYASVQYGTVYPGIDAIFYGKRRHLEYDLVVAPRSDPRAVKLQFDGVDGMSIDRQGDLVLRAGGASLRLLKPVIYQHNDGKRIQIAGAYALDARHRQVSFTVGDYDRGLPLVIDPVLVVAYSSLLGGSNSLGFSTTSGQGIAVDAQGSAYVAGFTNTTDFPIANALQPARLGAGDAFIVKFDPSGSSLVYATYFGGSTGGGSGEFQGPPNTVATGVAVDAAGNAYFTGWSTATDLAIVNGFQSTSGGEADGFIAKLNTTGSTLVYSSYFGGSLGESSEGIVLGPDGAAFVAGGTSSTNFPTVNALQPGNAGGGDAFVLKVDTAIAGPGSLKYSTYIGGPQDDAGMAIAVDGGGNALVAGIASSGFPEVNGITLAGSGLFETFLSKVSPDGSVLLYSTLLGGSDTESAQGVGVDASGNAYVAGWTTSTDFRVKGAHQPGIDGFQDAFVAKFNTLATGEASLVYSTYFGGDGGDQGTALAVRSDGTATLAGYTESTDFPTIDGLAFTAGSAFVARFGPTGVPDFSTRLGENLQATPQGVAVDAEGGIYLTGDLFLTGSDPDFPATAGAFQSQLSPDSLAAFVTKLGDETAFGVSGIEPNRGGNTGHASTLLSGTGFDSTTVVRLVRAGQPDIIGNVRLVNSTLLSVSFDLHGAPQGVYDVVVTDPDGSVQILSGGYTVEAGRPPQMWVDVVGPTRVRNRWESAFTVFYGNRGNTDALGVVLTLSGIPTQSTVRLGFDVGATALSPDLEPFRVDHLSPVLETPNGRTIMLFLGLVPAGVVGNLTIHITTDMPVTTPPQTFQLKATASTPFFGSPIRGPSAACMSAVSDFVMAELADQFLLPPGAGCVKALGEVLVESLQNFVDNAQNAYAGTLTAAAVMNNFAAVLGSHLNAQLACAADAVGLVVPEAELLQFILSMLSKLPDLYDTLGACSDESDDASDTGDATAVGSADPNEKIGGGHSAPHRFISGSEPLRYAVHFENLPTATAPAQEVVITDQLDASKLDLNSFSLGPISFGSLPQLLPPPRSRSFETDVDLRPVTDLIVRVRAHLDMTTGLLMYRLTSLDPLTGLPPTDPLAGFLPPNLNSPEGSGAVLFTVMPKAGLPTGTIIRNAARIVFDANDPIDTAEWLNTIDNAPPTSAVVPLAGTSTDPNVLIQWSGNDPGAGVRDFTVYVSENGGPFALFAQHTPVTSAVLTGQVGHTYAFYSIARDLAGNVESVKTVAEASVTIVPLPPPPPPSNGSMSGGGFVAPAGVKWHFVFNAAQESKPDALEIWSNDQGKGEPKRFLATSMTAVVASQAVRVTGTGTWGGGAGYRFEASASDRGEPGRNDEFSFVITDPQGRVVASVSGKLAGGNIQWKQ